jgi:squalene-hopene/tetraprenyl-beta-curcumene cyclase
MWFAPRQIVLDVVCSLCLERTMKTLWRFAAALLCVSIGMLTNAPAGSAKKVGPEAEQWETVVAKAVRYLKDSQEKNGGWSTAQSPGVTGVVLSGLLSTGQVTVKDPVAENALKYIEGLVNPKAGHIAGKNPREQLQNYVTSINVLALTQANRADKYKAIIGDAVEFLKKLQWDEGEGKDPKSDFYGGAGYDSKSRPDLSNTQFFLDALKAAGVPKDDPAYRKALIFLNRCHNSGKEYNDQPWGGKIKDGSFIYTPADGGTTKVVDKALPDGSLPGYGSMTYAGIKSMIYCGVSKDDPRIKMAWEWIRKNYTVDGNPGMPGERAQWGLYYYYHTMAKTLDVLGEDFVVDAKGVKHDWRTDITAALAKRQHEDGSWQNDRRNWMEADPNLVAGYALMALSHCRPRAK